jgi:hypothetical protein
MGGPLEFFSLHMKNWIIQYNYESEYRDISSLNDIIYVSAHEDFD